jgi:hypothetical protein
VSRRPRVAFAACMAGLRAIGGESGDAGAMLLAN